MKFIVLLILMSVLGKSGKDRRGSDIFKLIMGFYLLSFGLNLFIRFPFIPLALVGLLAWGIYSLKKKSDMDEIDKRMSGREDARKANRNPYSNSDSWDTAGERKRTYTENTSTGSSSEWQSGSATSSGQSQRRTQSAILPRPMRKRIKIVSEFNQKFKLTLTEDEVKRIVESSYMSESWKREVESMTARYETVHEWFYGDTSWLRVYIYAFEVQNISSDFEMQEKYAQEAFDEVFHYAESLTMLTLPEKIARVNDRFFATFDEASFMIAYRYMEQKGMSYDLGSGEVLKNEDAAEQAMHKYATH